MSKKMLWLLLVLFVVIITIVALIVSFYYKQEHVILTKKFHTAINKEINISYFESNTSDHYYHAALKVSEDEYEEMLRGMKKSNYYLYEDFDELNLQDDSKWMNLNNIVQAYAMDTVEYSFLSSYRVHAFIFITDLENGYRDIYMLRN